MIITASYEEWHRLEHNAVLIECKDTDSKILQTAIVNNFLKKVPVDIYGMRVQDQSIDVTIDSSGIDQADENRIVNLLAERIRHKFASQYPDGKIRLTYMLSI